MKIRKKVLAVLFAVSLNTILCGALFKPVSVTIDTEEKPVYAYCTADKVLLDFADNDKGAKDTYDDQYVLITGKAEDISKNGKRFSLEGVSEKDNRKIECSSSEKEIINVIKGLTAGDNVAIYGKLSVSDFNGNIKISIDEIADSITALKSSKMYFLKDGEAIDYNSMKIRKLNNGRVKYYIPPQWEAVEYNLQENDLGLMEGYQYVLNKLPGSGDPVPESFFVCYFDNEELLANAQNDSSETKLIEKAIIENISGEKAGKFPIKEVKTYYDARYQYYQGTYMDFLRFGYHTEYVFEQDGDDGIVMYLYVYRKESHLDDIMFVTRFLEIR